MFTLNLTFKISRIILARGVIRKFKGHLKDFTSGTDLSCDKSVTRRYQPSGIFSFLSKNLLIIRCHGGVLNRTKRFLGGGGRSGVARPGRGRKTPIREHP